MPQGVSHCIGGLAGGRWDSCQQGATPPKPPRPYPGLDGALGFTCWDPLVHIIAAASSERKEPLRPVRTQEAQWVVF